MIRIALRLMLFLIVLTTLFVIIAPTILSTDWGRQIAVDFFNKNIPGKLSVDKSALSWIGPQKLEGIKLQAPGGETVLTLGSFTADGALLCLLRNPLQCGDITFSELNIAAQVDEHGYSNLERSLLPTCCVDTTKAQQPPMTLSLDHLQGVLRFPKEAEPLELKINGQTTYNGQAGNVGVRVEIQQKLFEEMLAARNRGRDTLLGVLKNGGPGSMVLKGQMEHFPTALVDQILLLTHSPHAGTVSKLLGATLDVTAEQSMNDAGAVLTLRGKSPTTTFTGDIIVSDKSTLHATVNKLPVALLTEEGPSREVLRQLLGETADIVAAFHTDGAAINGTLTLQGPNLAATEIALSIADKTQLAHPINVNLSLDTSKLMPPKAPQTTSATVTLQQPILVNVIVDQLELPLSYRDLVAGTATVGTKDLSYAVRAATSPLKFVGDLSIGTFTLEDLNATVSATQGSQPQVKVTGALVQADPKGYVRRILGERTNLTLAVHSLHLGDLAHMRMNGSLNIDSVAPTNGQAGSLKDIVAQWVVDGSTGLMATDFQGLTLFGQEAAGKFNGSVAVENWIREGAVDLAGANLKATFHARRLPTEIIAFKYGGSDLAQIFGHAADVSITSKITDLTKMRGDAFINVHSEKLHGDIAVTFDDSIRLNNSEQPATIVLKVTPEAHAAIRNLLKRGYDDPFQLTDSSKIVVTLSSLDIPLPFSPARAALAGSVEIDQIVGMDKKTQQKLALESIAAQFSSRDISQQVSFNMTGRGQAATSINLSGALEHPFTPQGDINMRDVSVKLEGNLVAIPAPLLCKVFCSDTLLSHQSNALFGPTFDAKINVQLQRMNGPVSLKAQGKNGNISVDAYIQDGVLTLTKDLSAQVAITPQLGQYVLQEYIPILNGIQSSDQPLTITIDKNGFAVPVRDISPLSVSVGMAKVDLGKVHFSPQSQLAKALSLLTPPNNQTLNVWLTPTYLSMNSGIVKLERVDMLLNDRYPLAAWGVVNLVKEKVDMIIGLSGAAIASAFNVSSVPRSFFLQVPFKGPLDNPSLDKTRVVGRLSALAAQAQGSTQGMVIGTVIDALTGGLKEAAPPKPTTQPLPWQNLMEDPEGTATDSGKSNPIKVPLEEVTKGANSLLKKLLNK